MGADFRRYWPAWVLGLLLVQVSAAALDDMTPRQRRDLELLATGRARLALAQEIQTTVQLRTASEWPQDLALALRYWLRSAAEIRPVRVYANQLTEADASVSTVDLNDWLAKQQVESRRPRDQRIWGTGSAVADDLPTDQRPLGWRRYVAETVEATRRQAEDNAVAALLIDHASLLRRAEVDIPDQLGGEDTLVRQWKRALRTAGRLSTEVEPDLLAAGLVSLSGERFLEILAEIHTLTDTQRSLIERVVRGQTLTAVGLSEPLEADRLPAPSAPVVLDAPAWEQRVLRARGVVGGRKEEDEKRRGARVAAIDALRRDVLALEVRDGVTLERYLERVPELKPDVVEFLSGARIVRTVADQRKGTVRIEVTLPLSRLWELLRGSMRAVPVGG